MMHETGHLINSLLGTGSQESWSYKFYSGAAGNILIAVAFYKWYRHNKCHYCPRLGHHVPHYHWPVCHKHRELTARSMFDGDAV